MNARCCRWPSFEKGCFICRELKTSILLLGKKNGNPFNESPSATIFKHWSLKWRWSSEPIYVPVYINVYMYVFYSHSFISPVSSFLIKTITAAARAVIPSVAAHPVISQQNQQSATRLFSTISQQHQFICAKSNLFHKAKKLWERTIVWQNLPDKFIDLIKSVFFFLFYCSKCMYTFHLKKKNLASHQKADPNSHVRCCDLHAWWREYSLCIIYV